VSCDPGGHELGGGGRAVTDDDNNPERVALTQSYESSDTARTVVGVVTNDLASTESLDVIATILCAY
jgi:hypothetical protein